MNSDFIAFYIFLLFNSLITLNINCMFLKIIDLYKLFILSNDRSITVSTTNCTMNYMWIK